MRWRKTPKCCSPFCKVILHLNFIRLCYRRYFHIHIIRFVAIYTFSFKCNGHSHYHSHGSWFMVQGPWSMVLVLVLVMVMVKKKKNRFKNNLPEAHFVSIYRRIERSEKHKMIFFILEKIMEKINKVVLKENIKKSNILLSRACVINI